MRQVFLVWGFAHLLWVKARKGWREKNSPSSFSEEEMLWFNVIDDLMGSWSRAVPDRASHFDSGQAGPQCGQDRGWNCTEVPCGGYQRKFFRWGSSLNLCNQVHCISVMLLISPRRLQCMWKDTVSFTGVLLLYPFGIGSGSGDGDGRETVQGV